MRVSRKFGGMEFKRFQVIVPRILASNYCKWDFSCIFGEGNANVVSWKLTRTTPMVFVVYAM